MMGNECDECGKKVKVCFRSKNKRYKLYICRECKSKEENNSDNADKANKGVKLYCKNPKCFTHYLATHKIKEVDSETKQKKTIE